MTRWFLSWYYRDWRMSDDISVWGWLFHAAVGALGGIVIALLVIGATIAWTQPADSDGDGWSDEYEMYLPTGHLRPCPLSLGDAAWPPDLNNDTFVDVIHDIAQLSADFGLPVDAPNVAHREDISPEPGGNQFIDIFDITKAANYAFQSCTP